MSCFITSLNSFFVRVLNTWKSTCPYRASFSAGSVGVMTPPPVSVPLASSGLPSFIVPVITNSTVKLVLIVCTPRGGESDEMISRRAPSR
jgi:hypothetical protein